MGLFSGPGVTPSLKGLTSNVGALAPGQTRILRNAGWYMVNINKYTTIQQYDPIAAIWRGVGGGNPFGSINYIYTDGQNYRLANLTGCAVGALLTAAGAGYTSVPIVTPSVGGSIWRAVVGGALSTTVTVTNGGSMYTYPPTVRIAAPPSGGVQATGYAVLTGSVVTSIVIVDQGAGYTIPPTITLTNDPREVSNPLLSAGSNASAVATLTGAGTITAILCVDHGGVTGGVIPTLTIAGGGGTGAAATAIMCWTIVGYAAGTAGAGLAGTAARITAEDAFPTTAPAYLNPTVQSQFVFTRSADIKAPITGGGIAAGGAIYDGGIYTSVPTPLVIPTAGVTTTAPVVTFTMGGVADTIEFTPV